MSTDKPLSPEVVASPSTPENTGDTQNLNNNESMAAPVDPAAATAVSTGSQTSTAPDAATDAAQQTVAEAAPEAAPETLADGQPPLPPVPPVGEIFSL